MPKDRGIQVNDSNDNGTFMDAKVDVVRDAQGKIVQGLVVGDTLQQNKAFILMAEQGEYKFRPDLGVGIKNLLLDDDWLGMRNKIRDHFAKDNLTVTTLDVYANKPINIVASYE